MDHLEQTVECYDQRAEHFVQTRNKYRPEVELMLSYLPEKKPLRVLELGCGGGRLYDYLKIEIGARDLKYVGVDNAQGMISSAKKQYPRVKFVCEDMISYLDGVDSNSVDCLIALASIQHIYPSQNRILIFQQIYDKLAYGGKAILVNRSFSRRFLNKYPRQIFNGVVDSIWKRDRSFNDYMIPWKSSTDPQVYHRYYHIYTLYELRQLARLAGFTIEISGYVDRDGTLSTDRKSARNTFIVVGKNIYK